MTAGRLAGSPTITVRPLKSASRDGEGDSAEARRGARLGCHGGVLPSREARMVSPGAHVRAQSEACLLYTSRCV